MEFLDSIPQRILELSLVALKRANTDSIFRDRGKEHHATLAPISTAHAGELLLKALIAQVHPLLIFENLHQLKPSQKISKEWLENYGKTHNFDRLPTILKATTNIDIPDMNSFRNLQRVRNQIQHFLEPDEDPTEICIDFIYNNIDPLLYEHFDESACEFHEDQFDDYVIAFLIESEIKFSLPTKLEMPEFGESGLNGLLRGCSPEYRTWLSNELSLRNVDHLRYPPNKP